MINIKKIYIRSNLHTSVYTPVWNWNNTHKAVHVLTTIMQHPYFFIFHVIPFQFFPFWEERPLVWNILISEIAGPDYSYLGKNRHMNVASMMTQMVNSLPAMQETWVQSLCEEDPLGKNMTTHYSTLAWEIPWTEEPGGLQSMGSRRIRHEWATKPPPSGIWKWKVKVTQSCPPVWDPVDCTVHGIL